MGLLNRFMWGANPWGYDGGENGPMSAIPGVTPFMPQQPPPMQPASPLANLAPQRAPSSAQPFTAPPGFMTPQPAGAAPQQPQGFWGRLGQNMQSSGWTGGDWLQLSAALFAAGEPGGGGWGTAAQALGNVRQGAMDRRDRNWQRQRIETADARDAEQWSWARDERTQAVEQRRLAQEYIASRPPEEQRELRMIPAEELGGYIQQQRQFGLQERGLDLQIQEMRNTNAYRNASLAMDQRRLEQDRILNSAQNVLGREEASRLGADMARLRGWSLIDNDLSALEEILDRNPAAFNNLMDADVEQALARIRDPQTRRDVQTIYSIATSMAREELRGQTPVSNIDMLAAVRGAPSPSSGHLFARDFLERAYQDRSELENYVQGALSYMQQPDGSRRSLFEPDPATGRNFYQGDTFRRYTQEGRQSFRDVSGGAAQGGRNDDAASAAAALQARRRAQASAPANFGTLGGRAGAPRLLREPNAYEATVVRQYEEARRANNQARVRVLETRLRQRGLIP